MLLILPGTEICVKQGMEALVKGGTQVLVGYSASGDMNLPTSLICDKEITIKQYSVIVLFIH